jgi:hypothetical protein
MTFETSGAPRASHVHEALSEYLDGGLSEPETRDVAAHLATCSRCQADLATLRLSVGSVRSLPLRPAPRSFALPVARSRTPALITWLRVSSGALAAAFVAVLAAQVVLNNGTPPASAPTLQRSTASRGVGSPVDGATAISAPRPQVANPAPPAAAPAASQPAAAPATAPQSPAAPAAPRPAPAGPGSTPPANQSVAKGAAGGQVQVAGSTPTSDAYPQATTPVVAPSAPPVVSYPGDYPAPSGNVPTEIAPTGGAPSGSVISLGGRGSWFTPALAILGLLTIVSIGAMLLLSRRH